jgi:hypothetical protein
MDGDGTATLVREQLTLDERRLKLLNDYCDSVGLSDDTKRFAERMLSWVEDLDMVSGRAPTAIAATLTWMVGRLEPRRRVSQHVMYMTTRVFPLTMSRNAREFSEGIEEAIRSNKIVFDRKADLRLDLILHHSAELKGRKRD